VDKQLHTAVDIDATPERVWEVLTDFAAYPQWNPFMPEVTGTPRVGERLKVRLQPPGGRGMTFQPTVLAADPGRQLRWLGRLLLPRVFDGEHSFTIEPVGDHKVRFVQQERFGGVLVRFLAGSLDRRTLPGFQQMNQALKRRAEQPS
jgi:hypothetical protein